MSDHMEASIPIHYRDPGYMGDKETKGAESHTEHVAQMRKVETELGDQVRDMGESMKEMTARSDRLSAIVKSMEEELNKVEVQMYEWDQFATAKCATTDQEGEDGTCVVVGESSCKAAAP